MLNALTIDVEDWYHVCGIGSGAGPLAPEARVVRNVDKILALLQEYRVRATFFVLGSVAEAEPSLVPAIAGEGHEIASHGWSHSLVSELTAAAFADELVRTADLLEAQTGRRPAGFRAPQWSLGPRTPWAFRSLAEAGLCYDSSLNPLPVVGDKDGLRGPSRIETAAGGLIEIPPMVTPTIFGNMPTGGGWGFRFFPTAMIERTVARYEAEGIPAVLYLHPREVDPEGPRLRLPRLKEFVTYGPRSDVSARLRPLLERFSFVTMEQVVNSWVSVS